TADTLSDVDVTAVSQLRRLRAGGGVDLYSQLVDLFRKSSTDDLTQLRTALEAADFKTAGAVCHKLTSSAANVGATAFSKHVRKMEQLCIAGDAGAVRDLHVRLEKAHPALMEELSALKANA